MRWTKRRINIVIIIFLMGMVFIAYTPSILALPINGILITKVTNSTVIGSYDCYSGGFYYMIYDNGSSNTLGFAYSQNQINWNKVTIPSVNTAFSYQCYFDRVLVEYTSAANIMNYATIIGGSFTTTIITHYTASSGIVPMGITQNYAMFAAQVPGRVDFLLYWLLANNNNTILDIYDGAGGGGAYILPYNNGIEFLIDTGTGSGSNPGSQLNIRQLSAGIVGSPYNVNNILAICNGDNGASHCPPNESPLWSGSGSFVIHGTTIFGLTDEYYPLNCGGCFSHQETQWNYLVQQNAAFAVNPPAITYGLNVVPPGITPGILSFDLINHNQLVSYLFNSTTIGQYNPTNNSTATSFPYNTHGDTISSAVVNHYFSNNFTTGYLVSSTTPHTMKWASSVTAPSQQTSTVISTVFSFTTVTPGLSPCNNANSCLTNQFSAFMTDMLPSLILIALAEYSTYKLGAKDDRVYVLVFMFAISAVGAISAFGGFGNGGIPWYIPIFSDIIGFMFLVTSKGGNGGQF